MTSLPPSITSILSLSNPHTLFRLHTILGEGSSGIVYSATSLSTPSSHYAIKIIPLGTPAAIAEVSAELSVLSSLSHANLIGHHGAYLADASSTALPGTSSALWLVMDLAQGGSLGGYLDLLSGVGKPRCLPEPAIACVLAQIFDALAYLHAHSVLHRDVKADNILLASDGRIKLGDFGIAAQISADAPVRSTFAGTPYWMAPELIGEGPYAEGVDVWAAGITAIELAQGKPPLSQHHPMHALFLIPDADPPCLDHPDQWSPEFADFLASALVKDPALRPSAQELRSHPFIANAPSPSSSLVPLMEQAVALREASRKSAVSALKSILSDASPSSPARHRPRSSPPPPPPSTVDAMTTPSRPHIPPRSVDPLPSPLSIQERLLDENKSLKTKLIAAHKARSEAEAQAESLVGDVNALRLKLAESSQASAQIIEDLRTRLEYLSAGEQPPRSRKERDEGASGDDGDGAGDGDDEMYGAVYRKMQLAVIEKQQLEIAAEEHAYIRSSLEDQVREGQNQIARLTSMLESTQAELHAVLASLAAQTAADHSVTSTSASTSTSLTASPAEESFFAASAKATSVLHSALVSRTNTVSTLIHTLLTTQSR